MIYYTRSCREFRVSCYLDQVVSEGSRWVWCQFGEIVEHLVSDYQQPGWTLTSILEVHRFHSNLSSSRVCEQWEELVWLGVMCLCRVGAPLPVLGAPCTKRHSGCAVCTLLRVGLGHYFHQICNHSGLVCVCVALRVVGRVWHIVL